MVDRGEISDHLIEEQAFFFFNSKRDHPEGTDYIPEVYIVSCGRPMTIEYKRIPINQL